jgi:transposase
MLQGMKPCIVPIDLPFCETESVVRTAGGIDIHARLIRWPGICPRCGQLSNRVHGYYERTLLDLPVSQLQVRIKLRVRRYRCSKTSCGQQTFSQQVRGLFEPYQRATERLLTSLYHIAQVAGGQVGARLAGKLAMPTSGSTLLRLIRRRPETGPNKPRILGIDDWAMRKGQRYGTILVDLEQRRVVDLLPDRTAATLTSWLKEHPSVVVTARDRSLEYALGIRDGAPEAIQVADRWHLLKNLGEVAEKALHELYPSLKKQVLADKASNQSGTGSLRDAFPRTQTDELARQERRLKRWKRYELIRYFSANGLSHRRIAHLLNVSRGTVIRYAKAEVFPERERNSQRRSILDPFLPYLESRFLAGDSNAHQLWREIKEQGYPGSKSQVSKWMAWRRHRPEGAVPTIIDIRSPVALLPSAKALTRLLLKHPATLSAQEGWLLERLWAIPEIIAVKTLATDFQEMVRHRESERLDDWLARCHESRLGAFARFADSLAQDYAAVEAALATNWSNGQTEGQINRLKLLKRQMYGRANLDLLRQRVLYHG